jgi:hypothetical protein
MAAFSGPEIPNGGLVFDYDMSNTQKSWMGAPTTNLLTYSNQFEMWSSANVTVVLNTTIAPDGTMTADSASNTPSAGSYLYPGAGTTGYVVSTQYTRSVYAKAGVGTGILVFEWLASGSGTFNLLTGTASGTGASIISVGNGWYRCICTATYTGTGGGNAWYIGAYGSTVTATTLYLWGAQVETSSFVTPLVTTTTAPASRSNTQSILDLAGSNTITASSLTYAANNTFSFNGSNSITIPYNASWFPSMANEQTLIIWMKNTSSVTARRNPFNNAYGGAGTITHENDTNFNYFYGTGGSDTTPYTALTSSFTVVVNETAMIAFTRTLTTVSSYKNGVFGNSMVNPYGACVVGTNPITIGSGYAGAFMGNLYAVQLYNRALTATEVSLNFEAMRDRYGI